MCWLQGFDLLTIRYIRISFKKQTRYIIFLFIWLCSSCPIWYHQVLYNIELYPLYQVGHQKLLKNHLLCGNVGETIVRGFGVVVRGVCLPYTQV